ncbi:MAG: c-type cytochrome [Aquabacterium sp.]
MRRRTLAMLMSATMALGAIVPVASQAAGDIDRGGDVFDTQCAECHSVKPGKNKKGPTMFATFGRKAGTVPDFVYSEAMKQSGIVWTPEKVSVYVANPKGTVPGGKMKFDGKMSPQEISDLLAFLGTLH